MKKILEYNSSTEFLTEILKLDPNNVQILCPYCGQEMLFAASWERAKELGIHPGIYCQTNKEHVMAMFELLPPAGT